MLKYPCPNPRKAAQTRQDVFQCSAGHTSSRNEKQVLVPSRVRDVRYTVWATSKEGITRIFPTRGREVVTERPYCFLHAASAPPPFVEPEVEKTFRYQSVRPLKAME